MNIKLLNQIRQIIPLPILEYISREKSKRLRANIIQPSGALQISDDQLTFIMVVGSSFNQERFDAMMTCRMGYCHAFEQLGIPYLIVDIRDLPRVVEVVSNPFCMFFAGDLHLIDNSVALRLKKVPCVIWVYPWFDQSSNFFKLHGLNPSIWTLPKDIIRRIFMLDPKFVFTATTESGLGFFENWERAGLKVLSYPLACDTSIYNSQAIRLEKFTNTDLAFVGGYWRSKGVQIDDYLLQFENELKVYGYSEWPYKGYSGKIDVAEEPSLYLQARVSPAINEPTVSVMKGQINERVFKVFGSGGCCISDAIPTYRDLYSKDELMISKDPGDFAIKVRDLLNDSSMNDFYRKNGYLATIERHTYSHRAAKMLKDMALHIVSDGKSTALG
jgi:hypothetical protein